MEFYRIPYRVISQVSIARGCGEAETAGGFSQTHVPLYRLFPDNKQTGSGLLHLVKLLVNPVFLSLHHLSSSWSQLLLEGSGFQSPSFLGFLFFRSPSTMVFALPTALKLLSPRPPGTSFWLIRAVLTSQPLSDSPVQGLSDRWIPRNGPCPVQSPSLWVWAEPVNTMRCHGHDYVILEGVMGWLVSP